MSDRMIIYHNDHDGFCAAWLCHRVWPDAEFIPVQYGQDPPDVTGKWVMIVDFSWPRAVLEEMNAKALWMLVLDHHKSAQKELEGLAYCRFDMNKSGARMALEWLQKFTSPEVKNQLVPKNSWLVDYTEDRDLWRFKLPNSRGVNAGLRIQPFDFSIWNILHANPTALARCCNDGEAILEEQKVVVDFHVKRAYTVELEGFHVLCVNASCLQSEIGNKLCKNMPYSVTWFVPEPDKMVFSLRSDESGLDVSEVAKAYGGGGHARAARFSLPLGQGIKLIRKAGER